jgi:predicted DNA-binding transcriptional regulator AlpA
LVEQIMDEARRVFTIAEFLQRYGIGRSRFYEEVAAGRLPLRKLGKKSLVAIDDAEKWLASLPIVSSRSRKLP